ncbi:hypothetical protein [Kordiimonas pumila]|uniref:DUF3098 domain-containing protein n=1 Tax=Kordiimonas pumila TaxID=2161677 RepID=A0ABV7D5S3_9PROT|nr:hypothetical protein [Kordiimonas pumila]
MSSNDTSINEGLAEIVKEEAQFSFGVNRYFLGILAFGLFFGGLFLVLTGNNQSTMGQELNYTLGPILIGFGILCSLGAWRANIIHKKLKDLTPSGSRK